MDLNQAMLTVAASLDGRERLTERVRAALLGLLAGSPHPPRLDPALVSALRTGLAGQREGDLYQELLRREVVVGDQGLAVRLAPEQHRRSGAYYTTEPVVQYMVRRAQELQPGVASLIDPACGAGALLEAAMTTFGRQLTQVAGWDLDPVAVDLCRAQLPVAAVACCDALLTEGAGEYDLCLGNPPYISSGLRGATSQQPERLRALRERYPHSAQYKLNTYPLFVERGLELLREGGVLGYILPDSFLTGRYFAGLRRLLLSHSLIELTLIRQDFWAHGRVGQSVILFVRKGAPEPGHTVRVRICDTPADLLAETGADLPLADLAWGPLDRFRLVPDPEHRQLLRRMEVSAGRLGDWLHSYSGLIARNGQASLIAPPAQTEANKLPHPAEPPLGRLLRSGREIDRYHLAWAGERVRLDPALIKSGGNRAYYEGPKLLLRQTADSLRAVYDDQGYYCLNNIHLLVSARPDANLRALLGLINSAPVGRYYQAVAMENGRLYAQVDLDILEGLPVPDLAPEVIAHLEALVRARESAAPDEAAPIEQQIDHLVTRCYGL